MRLVQFCVPSNARASSCVADSHAAGVVDVARDDDVRFPTCDCIDLVRAPLNAEGAELGVFRDQGRRAVSLYVRRITYDAAPPPFVLARFCPFCGTPYAHPDEQPDVPPLPGDAESIDPREAVLALIRAGLVRLDLVVTHDAPPAPTGSGGQSANRTLSLPQRETTP